MYLYVKRHIYTVHKYFGHNLTTSTRPVANASPHFASSHENPWAGKERQGECLNNRRLLTLLSLIFYAVSVQSFPTMANTENRKNW